MTTPDSKEAPERVKACPFCDAPGRFVWGLRDHGCVKCTRPGCDAKGGSFPNKRVAIAAWNTRADLVNREPSEGDVERVMRAIYGPDLDCEPAESGIEYGIFRRAALRAINAWRNP